MANNQNLIPFQKGDPRINRNGRPKKADIMRELAKKVCYEPVDLSTDPAARNHVQAILREWMNSGDFRKQHAVMEMAFGKVPAHETTKKELGTVIIDWDGTYIESVKRNGAIMKRLPTMRIHSLYLWLRRRISSS